MRDRIFITNADLTRLRLLVEGRRESTDSGSLEMLEQELDRAEIVEPDDIPKDVVTMNSEVRLQDLDTGEEKTYRLVFPSQRRTPNSLSVLAPIGTALLGYGVGDVVEWRVPKGLRRLKILEVFYQPEAAQVCGD